jgi:hypothetical protein
MDGRLMGRGCVHGVFTLEEHFRGPVSYEGVPGANGSTSLGHLVFWASESDAERGVFAGCPSALGAVTTSVGAEPASWYRCGGGIHSGHVMLVWQRKHRTYAVSAHGQTATNRELVRRVADRLDYVDTGS